MGRSRSTLVVGLALLELLSVVGIGATLIHSFPGDRPGTASPNLVSTSSGGAEIAQAVSSLAHGSGPAVGTPVQCGTTGGSGLRCSSPGPPSSNPVTLGPTWSRLPNSVPPPRRDAALVYDARDKYVLLFGGATPSAPSELGDTWKYSKGTWTQLEPLSSPAAREGAAIAFDTVDNYVVLYGGRNTTMDFSDTWTFAAGQWTQLTPAKSPGPLTWASLAYDANTSYAVLFGGQNASVHARAATWEFLAGAWTLLHPSLSPSPRWGTTASYDAKDGWIVLFGGTNGTGVLGDTWTFSAGAWKKPAVLGAPPVRAYASSATDPTGQQVVLFGGLNTSSSTDLSDTWNFSANVWTKDAPAVTPSGRYWTGLASGQANGAVTLFGGSTVSGSNANDTWTLRAGVWTHQLLLQPVARFFASMTYDEADRYVVLFGGAQSFGDLSDTWKFSQGAWTALHPSVAPSPRSGAAMVYDEADGYVLLFGGFILSGKVFLTDVPQNDTWSFLHGAWTQEPLNFFGPPANGFAMMAYDAADGYTVMFGGENNTGTFGDNITWTYLNGAWQLQFPALSPPPLAEGSAAYDSQDGYLLLFGYNPLNSRMETWTYVGGVWTNLTARQSVSPNDRYVFSMAYDSLDGYVLLFGGFHAGSVTTDSTQTWSFVGGSWTLLHPAANPGARGGPSMVYDAAAQRVMLFGGATDTFGPVGPGVWVF